MRKEQKQFGAFTLAEGATHVATCSNCRKTAFTLAEVLITLGIIGVVAAITMPILLQQNKNHNVETKLKKFYSTMNQAILLSEDDNGAKESWDFADSEFWDKYFAPYLKNAEKGELFRGGKFNYLPIYFADGSLLIIPEQRIITQNGQETPIVDVAQGCHNGMFYFPNSNNLDKDTFSPLNGGTQGSGVSYFAFDFAPNLNDKHHYHRGIEPFALFLNDDLSNLYSGHNSYSCGNSSNYRFFCTMAIAVNGWKIPKDYPFKVK